MQYFNPEQLGQTLLVSRAADVEKKYNKQKKVDFPDNHRHAAKRADILCRKDFIELIIRIASIEFPKMMITEAF